MNNSNKIYIIVAIVIVIVAFLLLRGSSDEEYESENVIITNKEVQEINLDETFKKTTEVEVEDAAATFIVNYVKEAIAEYRANGVGSLVGGDFRSYIRGEAGTFLYVINEEFDLVVLNHAFPETIGLKASDIRNADGVYIYKDVVFPTATAEGVWVEYSYIDPFDTKIKIKKDFIIKENGFVFGAGIYPIE